MAVCQTVLPKFRVGNKIVDLNKLPAVRKVTLVKEVDCVDVVNVELIGDIEELESIDGKDEKFLIIQAVNPFKNKRSKKYKVVEVLDD